MIQYEKEWIIMKFDINVVIHILSGLIICIPLLIKLINVTKEAIQNRNWYIIISLLSTFMVEAEEMYTEGTTKKDYVMKMIKQSAPRLNYNLTEEDYIRISDMIDELIAMTKHINVDLKDNSK